MLRFCDGFDSYTTTADLIKHKWHKYHQYLDDHPDVPSAAKMGVWEWNATEGVNGGGCVKHISTAVGDELGTQFSYVPREWSGRSQYSTLFWFKIAEPPATKEKLCQWAQVNSSGDFSVSLTMYIDSNGYLSFEVIRSIGFFGKSPETLYENFINVCNNEWHCLELAINFIVTPLTFRLGLDDFVLVDDVFDINVSSSGVGSGAKTFTFYSLGVDMWLDDPIIWDEAGDNPVEYPWGDFIDTRADEFIWDFYNTKPVNGDLNNFPERGQDDFFYWMGIRQITTLRPATAGTINDFDVVGAATKIDAVDDAMPTDGKYLEGNVPGARMLFNFQDFTLGTPVHSVVVNSLNVQADHGSIVAHAEALNTPDFLLGIRRRISGGYEVLPDGVNLVPNGGPNFVDLTGWTNYEEAVASIVDGRLRITHTSESHVDPDPMIEIAIPVTPNSYYLVTAQRPIRGEGEQSGNIVVAGATISGNQNSRIDSFGVINSLTGITLGSEVWHVPINISTLYLQLQPWAAVPGYYDLDWVTVEKLTPEFDFKHYQWAFRKNPATLLEWDQASINSAEFGMRISP